MAKYHLHEKRTGRRLFSGSIRLALAIARMYLSNKVRVFIVIETPHDREVTL